MSGFGTSSGIYKPGYRAGDVGEKATVIVAVYDRGLS